MEKNNKNMLAVVEIGGKQYLVFPKQKLEVDKLNKKEGEEVVFDKVLLFQKEKKVEIGTPYVKGVKVVAKVLSHKKGPKLIVFKYKPKKRYRKKKGHRQTFTEIEIKEIKS